MIGRRKGYRVALVMPDNVTAERRQMAALFGAEVIDSPGRARVERGDRAGQASSSPADPRYVMPYQYGNPANPRAHEETTGPEILADCPEIDAFVAGLGTGGTLMGVARFFRERKPAVRIFAAEPLPGRERPGPALARRGVRPGDPRPEPARREVPRLEPGRGRRPPRARRPRGDLRRPVVRRRPGRARPRVAATMERGTIVALLPDGGWKYLSAGTYSRDLDEMEADLEGGVNWW